MTTLPQVPFGSPLNGSPHCVVSSMPRMADVIAYEEREPQAIAQMLCGYPRFVRHPLVNQVMQVLAEQQPADTETLPLASPAAAGELESFLGKHLIINKQAFAGGGMAITYKTDGHTQRRCKAFLQHTGTTISSRWAEDWLKQELNYPGNTAREAAAQVCDVVARSLGAPAGHVHLANAGMAAIYAAYQAVNAIQAPRNRRIWIQLGWLYVDTMAILKTFTPDDQGEPEIAIFANIRDLDTLEAYLRTYGHKVAGIMTESPTNPLMQTCDMPRLARLARQSGALLVCDPTLATPYNLNLLQHVDILTLSLTKYYACEGDVMLGALAVNPHSTHAKALNELADKKVVPAYVRDLERLACQVDGFADRMTRINASTMELAARLKRHPSIAKLHWAYSPENKEHYSLSSRRNDSPGSIISFTLNKPIAEFYDRVPIAKGPSFGTRFSLICPYLYLAHYAEVTCPGGRQRLADFGLEPDLLRFSTGLEDVEDIWKALCQGLD